MDDSPPYHLDINGLSDEAAVPGSRGSHDGRPWVGIRFECCGIYTRVYRNRAGTAYEGLCPRCTRRVRLKVGPDGTSSRFFVAE
ncbi:MAG: hypothetical protein HY763_10710 [Planctomycetes bacterium]|nr:hypothetical protein [Planctomycetota bacterium]